MSESVRDVLWRILLVGFIAAGGFIVGHQVARNGYALIEITADSDCACAIGWTRFADCQDKMRLIIYDLARCEKSLDVVADAQSDYRLQVQACTEWMKAIEGDQP
jgi:hypothetical protein